jgi:hypothetical protein
VAEIGAAELLPLGHDDQRVRAFEHGLGAVQQVQAGPRAQRRTRLCQRLGWGQLYLPDAGEFIGHWRLRDWLRLLDFEVEGTHFGCWRPAVRSSQWLERFRWFDVWGRRWWPILGAAYFVVAVKRVHGMRLLEPAWRSQRQRAGASVPLVSRAPGTWAGHHLHKD